MQSMHSTAEIKAIALALQYFIHHIKSINDQPYSHNMYHHYNIPTDSLTVLKYLNNTSYPKYENTRQQMNQILKYLQIINTNSPKSKISFGKCKAYSSDVCNYYWDKLARNKAKNSGSNRNKLDNISYQVSMSQSHHSV